MESGEGTFIHERKSKGHHISVENTDIQSNGHRSKVEPIELIETVRSLSMEVHSHIVYNENITRA